MIKKIARKDWEITFIDVDAILNTFFNKEIKDEKIVAFIISCWTQIDDVLEILRKKKKISFNELLKRSSLGKEQLHKLLNILEKHRYVKVEGGEITIATEEKISKPDFKNNIPLVVVTVSILVGLSIFIIGLLLL